jgi:hypothetical protein
MVLMSPQTEQVISALSIGAKGTLSFIVYQNSDYLALYIVGLQIR